MAPIIIPNTNPIKPTIGVNQRLIFVFLRKNLAIPINIINIKKITKMIIELVPYKLIKFIIICI